MSPLPKWFEALRKEPTASQSGLRWFLPEELEPKRTEFARLYGEGEAQGRQHLPPAARDAARTLLARFQPVGEGPAAVDRLGAKTRCWLLLDKSSPDELKVALSPQHPPFLWLGAGQTATSLKEALAPYFPAHVPPESSLERSVRGYLGTGGTGKLDLYQLRDRYKHSAFLDGLPWGGAFAKDPFGDVLPDKGAAAQEKERHYSAQPPQGAPSFSFRTLFSKSVLRAEAHVEVWKGIDLYVAELHYRPARHTALLQALNQRLGTKYPEDLPVDLAGALLGLPFDPPDVIRGALQKQPAPANLTFTLLCLDGLARDNAAAEQELRPFIAHADLGVRQVVANLALRRGLKGLLSDMAGREQHAELKKQLTASIQRLA